MGKITSYSIVAITASCLTLLAGTANAKDASTLKIEHFIGTIDIRTGDYDEITVTDADGANYITGSKGLTVNDDKNIRDYNCRYKKDKAYIGKGKWHRKSGGKGFTTIDAFPLVKITAPENVHVVVKNTILFGDIESIGSGDIHVSSCGDLKLGDVNGAFNLRVSGSGDVKMGDAGDSIITISGSGDLVAGDFASGNIVVSGSGDLEAGDVIRHAKIQTSGSGDIVLARIKGGLEYSGSGSSDFEADYVGGGDLSIRVSGSSDITIKDGEVGNLYIRASGASDVNYSGSSVDAEARASGASDIYIRRPSGNLRTSDSGAADVNIR
ncbi:MAG: DUF2807 domain-containing protein [Robiginitomaculum sp.]|nr:DUF2807 domain-containing protein [Robiginitomaculum sp.]